MKIYKTIIVTCAAILAGQCLRTIAHPFMPTNAPAQAGAVTAYSEPLEIAMMRQGEAEGLEVLLPDNRIDARQPLFEPMELPPIPTVKPVR